MQRAWMMDTNATIGVNFTKWKDFGQSLRNTTLVNITRVLPESANATCNTAAVVPIRNAVYAYTSYDMHGNLTLLMDSSVYCDPPPRGARRRINLEFTFHFYFDFPAQGRRRRRTAQASQAVDAGGVHNDVLMTSVLTVDLYKSLDDIPAVTDAPPEQSGALRPEGKAPLSALAALATATALLVLT
jgi:hypothetical protein